ncbi:MAG: hypothetical protein HOK06_09195 [Rhodospirillaceae bacterium]|jgi:hypothetical protein|nr:hypothetical protein [Rhodospirillaceae bacterium]MBT4219105.1 hypothetical protein [Rhodospirillaceae bacterium]MBT4463612.1 hypothetical protein [Rhodospirillaceae bacterium]MBT5013507.1 hypothetical protein [Rhodospirillaceae bacterium]MBT5308237.1 hypothetical protein [Rhodospirillaceae bacterium]
MANRNSKRREVLYELHYTNSRSVRVVAIDPITGIEVTMVGDRARGEATLKRVAAQKLFYVINKKLGG